MTWAPIGFRGRQEFAEGEAVEIRYLPGAKTWDRATYVRRQRRDEVPGRGQLGHIVRLLDGREVTISCQRIRKLEAMITNHTITPEQIRALLAELVASGPRSHGVDECEVALNPMIDERTRSRARAVCASILNTRIHNARKAQR